MFRPRASSTKSRAMSRMRTQALPKPCRMRGSTSRPMAASTMAMRRWREFICMCTTSSPVRHAFTQQARWPQCENRDQHDEGKDVGVVATQHTPRKVADITGADGFDEPEQDTSHYGTGQVADAAKDRGREGLEPGQETHAVLHRAVVAGPHDTGNRGQHGAD